ncbi:MAG TPA: flavin monoamine oxidase family protein [Thermoanaerobaculia bacterium]|nr:flavin monoamine oxidase family protein [Thermoanaerobaculia bacterium]
MKLSRRDALRLLGAGAAATLLPAPARARLHCPAEGTRSADVAIVGAGFAGLTAARALIAAGREVVVLDARDRVGGRVKAGRIAGQTVDLGGQWVGAHQPRLIALLREYGIATTPQLVAGRGITELRGHRYYGEGEAMGLPPVDDAAVNRVFAKVRALVAQVPVEEPWTAPRAQEWDRITMDEWIRSEVRNPAARDLTRLMVQGLFTVEPEEVSLLFFLAYVRSGGSLEDLWGETDAAQAFHVPGSLHQLAGRMGAELHDRLALEAPVSAIGQDASGVTVTSAAGRWRAGRVIVAVPLPLSGRIAYDPAVPSRRDALTQRSPMGSVIKYWVAYREPFWRRKGLSALVTSDRPPTDGFFDASAPGAPVGLLVGFFEARTALAWTGRPMEERRAAIVARVADLLGPEGSDPLDYVDNDWPSEPWTRGCYGANMGPGVLTTLGPSLRAPVGRIHWAGTETSPVWSGYIEGAIASGQRAAAEVLSAPA